MGRRNYEHPIDNMVFQVLRLAVRDYYGGSMEKRREVERFFQSTWYESICALLDIDSEAFRNRVLHRGER